MGFLARTRPHTSIMVFALSPEIGPVTGATAMYVCGSGFVMTSDQVSGARCRFSDGYNTAEAAAGDPTPPKPTQPHPTPPHPTPPHPTLSHYNRVETAAGEEEYPASGGEGGGGGRGG